MFLCVAVPAILIGIIAWFYLADKPARGEMAHPGREVVADRRARRRGPQPRPAATARQRLDAGRGAQRPGLDAGVHLLRLHLRPLRAGVLPAHASSTGSRSSSAPSSTCSRRASSRRSRICPPPLCCYCGRVTPPSAACRPGTSPFPRIVGGRQRARRAVHGFTGGDHCGHHRDGLRHLRGTAELLDRARQVPHRGRSRRRHRLDQHRSATSPASPPDM